MSESAPAVEHLDVAIVGAGISGIGAGHYLAVEHPGKTFAPARGPRCERRHVGPVPLPRHPLGLRPAHLRLRLQAVARRAGRSPTAPTILAYLRETAAENGVDQHVRFHHRVLGAAWSTPEARWPVEVERTDTGERLHDQRAAGSSAPAATTTTTRASRPTFAGRDRFRGQIVHPQHWPEDLDYAGKRVVVIGSGATAVTLVPAHGRATAAHVTMLQRSPSYVMPVPRRTRRQPAAPAARPRAGLRASPGARTSRSSGRSGPSASSSPAPRAGCIRSVNAKQLPEGYPVDEHFNPPYDPWDQRLCAVPDGDLFRAIRHGERLGRHRPHRAGSPRPASAGVRRASSTPTSSSPRPGSTCRSSAACR